MTESDIFSCATSDAFEEEGDMEVNRCIPLYFAIEELMHFDAGSQLLY